MSADDINTQDLRNITGLSLKDVSVEVKHARNGMVNLNLSSKNGDSELGQHVAERLQDAGIEASGHTQNNTFRTGQLLIYDAFVTDNFGTVTMSGDEFKQLQEAIRSGKSHEGFIQEAREAEKVAEATEKAAMEAKKSADATAREAYNSLPLRAKLEMAAADPKSSVHEAAAQLLADYDSGKSNQEAFAAFSEATSGHVDQKDRALTSAVTKAMMGTREADPLGERKPPQQEAVQALGELTPMQAAQQQAAAAGIGGRS